MEGGRSLRDQFNSMNVLVVGCGSIGRRHIANLISLNDIDDIFVYSSVNNVLGLFNNPRVKLVKSLDNVDVAFAIIANETYRHIDTAIILAQKGINLFIEKPLSGNLKRINELRSIARKKKIKICVGYNLRFLGCIKYIKEQLEKGAIGNLYFAKIEAGQYLPGWRKNIGYKDCYSSSKLKGGGVSLDLSHEIDYMRYLFGEPVSFKLAKAKVSTLEIDSDDIFEALYIFNNNFICNIHLDYLQKNTKRQIIIIGSKGLLECDLVSQRLEIKKDNGSRKVKDRGNYFDIDKTYKDELRSFINVLRNNRKPEITLEDGVRVLELLGEEND